MASRAQPGQTGNRLLDALSATILGQLEQRWEFVSLSSSQEICREDFPLSHVYFPLSGIYSTVIRLEDGRVVEASTVGREGVIGLAGILGLTFSSKTATTPVSGECLRISLSALRPFLEPDSALERILHRYAVFALRNAYQTVACNAVHSAQERMCRWLLTNQDRVGDEPLTLTHEFLAQLLGVRRQTVTVIAGSLQASGLIRSQRGQVRVLNRDELGSRCCECYRVSRSLYERIVHGLEWRN